MKRMLMYWLTLIRERWPHLQTGSFPGGPSTGSGQAMGYCWRVFGLKPFYRCCLFDYTSFAGEWRIRLGSLELKSKGARIL